MSTKQLSPEGIFKLFFKYPFQNIPLIPDGEIKGYLSKEKTLKQASQQDFFSKPIVSQIGKLLDDISIEDFFKQVDALEDAIVPAVHSNDFKVQLFSVSDFNLTFRPIVVLEDVNYKQILDRFVGGVAILNSKLELVYANKKVKQWQKKYLKPKKDFLLLFSEEVYEVLKTPDPETIYTDRSMSNKITYRCQFCELSKGVIYIFWIINLFENNIGTGRSV